MPHTSPPTAGPSQSLHNISLPKIEAHTLDQDEAFFWLVEDGAEQRIRFHDYAAIYRRQGLYEQLFYQRLHCSSHTKARDVFLKVLADAGQDIHLLRVLDLGAGNGMVGELLDAARVIGVDICEQAKAACERDRPHAYDAYHVADMAQPDATTLHALGDWQLDAMTCIAALGFGDIPVRAFANAFNLVRDEGWIVFNIKESFLTEADTSGFSRLIKHLMVSDTLQVHHLERYRHRISIDGRPLFYHLIAGRKTCGIGANWVNACVA